MAKATPLNWVLGGEVNWDAIGAIGEIAGAVAVVLTLIYLSRQIRQNSKALDRTNEYAHAKSVHDINSLYVEVFAPLATDSELASIYQRSIAGEELDPIEFVRFGAFCNTFFAWLEDMYSQQGYQLGFVAHDIDSSMTIVAPYVQRLLQTAAGASWWESDAQYLYTPEFVNEIEHVRYSANKGNQEAT